MTAVFIVAAFVGGVAAGIAVSALAHIVLRDIGRADHRTDRLAHKAPR